MYYIKNTVCCEENTEKPHVYLTYIQKGHVTTTFSENRLFCIICCLASSNTSEYDEIRYRITAESVCTMYTACYFAGCIQTINNI